MQIRKALFGTELNSLNSLNASNDSLFEDPAIDNSVKEQAKALIAESQNEIQNRKFNSRDLVLYQLGVAQKVQDLLKNGKLNYSKSLTGDPQPNSFGYYSKYNNDFPVMVNNTVKTVAETPTTTATPEAQAIQTTIKPYVYFKPTEGFNFYTTEGQNQQSKTKSFAKELYGQLTKFLSKGYSSDSNVFQGISEDAIPELSIYATKLNQIAQKANITDQDTQTLADIVSKLNNEELSSGFETYFDVQNGIIGGGATTRAQAEAAAKEQAAKEADEYVNYLGGTLPDGKKLYIQIDPTKEDYKKVTIIDGDTKTSYDLGNQADIDKLNNLGLWQGITQLIKGFNKQFEPKDYTGYGLGHITDFSNYFTDEDPNNREIVSINWDDYPDLKFEDQLFMPFDKLFPDWETRKARFKFKGNADADTSGKDMNNQWSLSESIPDIDFGEIPDLTDQDIIDKYGGKSDNNGQINKTTGFWKSDKSFTDLFENSTIPGNFQQKMAAFIGTYCLALEDPETYGPAIDKMFPNYTFKTKNGDELGEAAMKQILANPAEAKALFKYAITHAPNAQYRKAITKVYKEHMNKLEKGGILKMFKGNAFGHNDSVVLDDPNNSVVSEQHTDNNNHSDGRVGNNISDEDAAAGIKYLITSAALDVANAVDPEPWSGVALALGSLYTGFAGNAKLKAEPRYVIGDVLQSAGNAALSTVPLFDEVLNSLKVSRNLKRLQKVFGTSQAVVNTALAGLGIVDVSEQGLLKKWIQDSEHTTPYEKQEVVRILKDIANSAIGTGRFVRGNRNPVRKTDEPKYMKVRNKKGLVEYVPYDATKYAQQIQKQKEVLDKLNFYRQWSIRKAHKDFAKELSEVTGSTVLTHPITGNPKTIKGYELDPEKMSMIEGRALKHPIASSPKFRIYKNPEEFKNKTFDPNETWTARFSRGMDNFFNQHFNWFKNYPVLYNNKVKFTNAERVESKINLIGLPKSTAKTQVKQYKIGELQDANIIPAKTLTDDIKKITGNNKVYQTTDRAGNPILVYIDEKRKNGGKLLHLQEYVKKHE